MRWGSVFVLAVSTACFADPTPPGNVEAGEETDTTGDGDGDGDGDGEGDGGLVRRGRASDRQEEPDHGRFAR